MPHYPDSFIEEVRERTDLLELVGRHVNLKKSGVNWSGLCPFHNEKTPSFSVRPDKGFFKCFGCGAGGDAYEFLMKIKGFGFGDAIEELAALSGLPLPEVRRDTPAQSRARQERRDLLDLVDSVRAWFQEQLAAPQGGGARAYLLQRGLKREIIERFQLGFAPPGRHNLLNRFGGGNAAAAVLDRAGLITRPADGGGYYDRFRNRIIFPIHDHQNRCVGFGGRLMDSEGRPKYLNSPETPLYHKSQVLYGLHQAQEAIQQEGWVLVVEGYMDLLALANHGIQAVVATLGTALTAEHLTKLWRRSKRVCFCFDGDQAGRKAAWRALEQVMNGLQADRHATFLFLPDGADPDDMVRREGAAGIRRRMEGALSLTAFLRQHLGEGLDLGDPEGRAALIHRARPLLWQVADPLLRELYATTIGQPFDISAEQVLGTRPVPPGLERGGPSGPEAVPYLSADFSPARGAAVAPFGGPGHGVRAQPAQPFQGRSFERALLALILKFPVLFQELEEELGKLELENPQLSRLLSELIELGPDLDEGAERWPLQRFSSSAVSSLAREIQDTETTITDLPLEAARVELDGCLKNVQLRHLDRQISRTTREIGCGTGDLARLGALQRERLALQLSKSRGATA